MNKDYAQDPNLPNGVREPSDIVTNEEMQKILEECEEGEEELEAEKLN